MHTMMLTAIYDRFNWYSLLLSDLGTRSHIFLAALISPINPIKSLLFHTTTREAF